MLRKGGIMESEITFDAMEFYGPGSCPNCGVSLYVADSEITLMELNKNGIPISEETVINCRAVCPKCSSIIPMMRHKGGYIPQNRDAEIWLEVQSKEIVKTRKENDKIKSNPLSIEG